MVILQILLTVFFDLLFYCFGLYVGGMKEKNNLRSRIQELEEENEKLKKIPMETYVVKEERRDVVPVHVNAAFPMDFYLHQPKKCGQVAQERLEREIGARVIGACAFAMMDDVPLQQKIFRASLDVIIPRNPRKIEHLIEEDQKRKRGNKMVSFEICKGNPGALSFLMSAYDADPFGAEMAFSRMDNHEIVGTMLYMLWNDYCGRDTCQALRVMRLCDPDEIRRHINYEGGRGIPFTPEELEEMNK